MIQDPMPIIAVCASVCALVFWSASTGWGSRVYKIVPSVVLIYYLPTLLSVSGVLPSQSVAYDWMRDYLLPFSIFLLMVTIDLPAVLRIGPMALAMMTVGALGIIIGGPIAFLCFKAWLPPDSWKALAALSGSWIGGGGNFAAVKEAVAAPDSLIGPIIVVDTAVAYSWTGILLILANYQGRFDRWTGAGVEVFRDLSRRLQETQVAESRPVTVLDVTGTVALGLVGAVGGHFLGRHLFETLDPVLRSVSPALASVFSEFTWMVIVITTAGLLLSLTPIQRFERGGASKIGYAALYLFLTSLGAKANPAGLLEAPVLLLVGVLWIMIHVGVLFAGAKLLRAPLFLVAVGSQANVGGAATAPIVAAAYYEGLAPVGVLMGVLGYVLGTYGGLLCAFLLRLCATL